MSDISRYEELKKHESRTKENSRSGGINDSDCRARMGGYSVCHVAIRFFQVSYDSIRPLCRGHTDRNKFTVAPLTPRPRG